MNIKKSTCVKFATAGLLFLTMTGCAMGTGPDSSDLQESEPETIREEVRGATINNTYLVGFGRQPTQTELNYWNNAQNYGVQQTLGYHADWLASSSGEQDRLETIERAYSTVYDRDPSSYELEYWSDFLTSHRKLYRNLVAYLADYGQDNAYPDTGSFCFLQYTNGYGFWNDCAYSTYEVPPG
jgi:hypothetical protein